MGGRAAARRGDLTGVLRWPPALTHEIDLLRSAVGDTRRAFLTSTAPASLEVYRGNEYCATADEYVSALAEALRMEYEAIANAGFLLQIDDAWTVAR